ncbi:energy-coupling factor transporter ATPase [Bacillaceae bacterium S4-13-58]
MKVLQHYNQPLLEIENLSFLYEEEGKHILKDVSFRIFQQENILLLGPSGSGKSTLAYCLNRLYPEGVEGALHGSIFYRGKNIEQFESGEINQRIGIVFQDPDSQFCMLSVEDELAFVLENHNVPPDKMEERIDETLELVGLSLFKTAMISSLSGGQKQKLALACVLMMNPTLLILDEPTANLDPLSSQELIQTISVLQKKRGFSMFIVEHRLNDWINLIDRCIVFNQKGSILYEGDPKTCFGLHAASLKKQGIWLPSPTEVGLMAQQMGHYQPANIPLTTKELVLGLENFEEVTKELFTKVVPRKDPKNTLLKINNLSFEKEGIAILKNINLSVVKGEYIALVGPNGSGKTTLSKCMAGLLSPTKGSVAYKNKDLTEWKSSSLWREIGYVFQNPEHQFVTDSVWEELVYGLRLDGKSEETIKALTIETLKSLGLEKQKDDHPFMLSQGQKRRLSVATMLTTKNNLLILDEPTFGQDAKTSQELMSLLEEHAYHGGTTIMITHDMDLVQKHADRVIVLKEGSLLFDGSPELLWQHKDLLQKARLKLPFEKELINAYHFYIRNERYVP